MVQAETASLALLPPPVGNDHLAVLESIQRRVLWLAANIVHEANHVRPNPDGTKVGGHQASSASVVTILTALYFHYLRSDDRIAIKPHASPAYHAVQYLLGNLDRAYLTTLRAFGGLQAYPSRTKDPDIVDFSTGSVGLGAVAPAFAALAGRYAAAHFGPRPPQRFVALMGDAELDEGNVWEAVAEEALQGLGNVLWVVDLNRQSLDRVVPGVRATQLKGLFAAAGWQVLEAKYGRRLHAVFAGPHGDRLRQHIDAMSNSEYQSLIRLDGATLRERLLDDAHSGRAELMSVLAPVADADLPGVIGDLGGHDFGELLRCFAAADADTDRPTVLFAYTIKGWGLPFAGDPHNHAQLLTPQQMDDLQIALDIPPDDPWASFPPDTPEGAACAVAAQQLRRTPPSSVVTAAVVPDTLGTRHPAATSTQEAFGRTLLRLADAPTVGKRIVTLAPDVATSTHLGGWINRVGIFTPHVQPDYEGDAPRLLQWREGPTGQHIELGISEMNLFMALGQFGLAHELVGETLIPIGTVYDPFVCRGLDALIHALYSGAKMIFAGTPSGVSLSPEGGAHQSSVTASLGIELPNLRSYEPTFACEVEWVLLDAVRRCCDREGGDSTYLRLSTKPIDQRLMDAALARLGEGEVRRQVLAGGYRLVEGRELVPGATPDDVVQIAATGTMVPEAMEAARLLAGEGIAANVVHITSAGMLHRALMGLRRRSIVEPTVRDDVEHLRVLFPHAERHAPMVTVHDAASHALAFLGGYHGVPVVPLGVDTFGQSGTRADLYRAVGIDVDTIVGAALHAYELGDA